MKKNKLRVIILFLIVIEGVFLYLNYKSYNNKENNQVFNEVKLADNLKGSKQIAIKQQKEDFTWEDKGTSMDAWPDIDTFEYYGSECTDASGNNITPTTDVIQFNEQTQVATISTSKTIYCTLKFARRSTVLKLMQETTNETYLKTVTGDNELLRYVGTQSDVTSNKLNNFICFGTENKDTCLADKNTYMYRIIGITTEDVNTDLGLQKDQLKIIKAAPPSDGTKIQWAKYNANYDWDNDNALSRIYLNNDYLKTINDITAKIGTHQWSDLISTPKWYKGDDTNAKSATGITNEKTSITTGNYKIGLMYASDYYNSWTYASNKNSWLNITNGMSENSSTYSSKSEMTMTRYASGNEWVVQADGTLTNYKMNVAFAVRPTFYLTNEISISGGGTEGDPFIISDRIVI